MKETMAHKSAQPTRRIWLPLILFGACITVFLGRLVHIQVINHEDYSSQASNTLLDNDILDAPRGKIFDRNGQPLVLSIDTWDLYISTKAWTDKESAKKAASIIANETELNDEDLQNLIEKSVLVDQIIIRDLKYETGITLMEKGTQGAVLLPNTARSYPSGKLALEVLGFIGTDNVGLAGIEATYNSLLAGKPGNFIYERDSRGSPIPFGIHIIDQPVPGASIKLTIDRRIQYIAEKELDKAIKKHAGTGGTVLVMNPNNGEILALASKPELSAITQLYEPGSVLKVITTAIGLDLDLITPKTTYFDAGITFVHGEPIRNWESLSYGLSTMTEVLQHSINTGSVFIVERIGAEQFYKYLNKFRLGHATGIDLPNEAIGIIPTQDDAGWSPVDLATQSFGQSISITPIQLISAFAATINGGHLIQPHLLMSPFSNTTESSSFYQAQDNQVISVETSNSIREMLSTVINTNIWHPARPKYYSSGGKSGTANIPKDGGYSDEQIVSFISFAPLDDPQIIVLVKIDQNKDNLTGTEAAGPVVARLIDKTLPLLNIPPTAEYVGAR
jgi:stage V sporulation protein D (sporulation-specific penicillin-binding protein)